MPVISAALLFPDNINGVEFDTLFSEQHGSQMAVTQYPVEEGAPITDHSYVQPKTLTLSIGHDARVSFFKRGSSSLGRLSELYTTLERFQEEGAQFDVATVLTVYRNVCVSGLASTRNKTNSTVATITVSLTEVRTVNLVDVPTFNQQYRDLIGVRTRAAKAAEVGRVNATEVPAESIEADNSTRALKVIKKAGIVQ